MSPSISWNYSQHAISFLIPCFFFFKGMPILGSFASVGSSTPASPGFGAAPPSARVKPPPIHQLQINRSEKAVDLEDREQNVSDMAAEFV